MILAAVLTLMLFAGCGEDQSAYVPTGDALAGDVGGKPEPTGPQETPEAALVYNPDATLNPYQCMDQNNRVLFSLLYQGLFTVDREYQVYPMLCESYSVSEDLKTYTFHITDALFSDGTALTAEDVAASLQAARKSSWYGSRLQYVSKISSSGDAVVIELKSAVENLPLLLDIPIVKAAEVSAPSPLGTGPYRMDTDQLKRQAGWWCSASVSISADTIRLVSAGTAAEIRDSFEFENVSLVCTDPSDKDHVDYHSDYELFECENGLFLYLACNESSDVFSNDSVRAALTHAIDRDALVEECYRGFARNAQLPCSAQAPWYDEILASNYGYQPELFTAALEKVGFVGEEVKLLLNGDDATRVKAGTAIAAMLEACGLKVTVVESDSVGFKEDLEVGDYDLYLAQTRLSANMDISAFFGTDTALNYGGLSDPGIYAISLEAMANEGNYYTLYEMVMDNGQLCPILFQSFAIYCRRGVLTDLDPSRDNVFFYTLGRTMEDARTMS